MSNQNGYPAPVLALAVAAISTAAVLVRLAPDGSPVAAALWRPAAAGLLLAPALVEVVLLEHARLAVKARAVDVVPRLLHQLCSVTVPFDLFPSCWHPSPKLRLTESTVLTPCSHKAAFYDPTNGRTSSESR
mgnify:CR=1 FL=1